MVIHVKLGSLDSISILHVSTWSGIRSRFEESMLVHDQHLNVQQVRANANVRKKLVVELQVRFAHLYESPEGAVLTRNNGTPLSLRPADCCSAAGAAKGDMPESRPSLLACIPLVALPSPSPR